MASASQIRPQKMIEAFKSIGCEVDVIEGTSKERAEAIKRIKKNINSGIQYDYMYAESSTMPTLLTDPGHLPLHPFLDFNFFKFVKKHGLKIGLFYRDIYWKFPFYKDSVSGIKRSLAIKMYKYDLRQYNKLLDKLYMPTTGGFKYVENDVRHSILDVLPPGCEHSIYNKKGRMQGGDTITLLYIGGLGNHYQMKKVLEVVRNLPMYHLVICCRNKEWQQEKNTLEPLLSDNIKVVHKSGDELIPLFDKADIGLLYFQTGYYMKAAMPYKTFEYMSYGLPMIASSGTAFGEYIEKQNLGWTIPYDNDSFRSLLINLYENKDEIDKKAEQCAFSAKTNRWEDRALKVQKDLT